MVTHFGVPNEDASRDGRFQEILLPRHSANPAAQILISANLIRYALLNVIGPPDLLQPSPWKRIDTCDEEYRTR
jgi:hypothetical protein